MFNGTSFGDKRSFYSQNYTNRRRKLKIVKNSIVLQGAGCLYYKTLYYANLFSVYLFK